MWPLVLDLDIILVLVVDVSLIRLLSDCCG